MRVLVFGNGASFPSKEFNKTFSIPIPGFDSTTVSPVSNLNSGRTILGVSVLVRADLPAGVKTLADPFVSYSRIEVLFAQLSNGQVIFDFDLGLGLDDLADPGCGIEAGFLAANNYNVSCSLRLGNPGSPLVTDFASVTAMNYAALVAGLSGVRVGFSIPVVYPSTVGVVPRVTLRLVRYDRKVKTVVREQTFSLSSSKAV
jgi:hypothetical protein